MQFLKFRRWRSGEPQDVQFEVTGRELSPGGVLERRMMLNGSLVFLAALFFPVAPPISGQEIATSDETDDETETIELETLIAD
jgi:hypothetical protein